MELNFYILIPLTLIIILLILWLIRRNSKDEKKFEGDKKPLEGREEEL